MLHTKFHGNPPPFLEKEDFIKVFFTINGHGGQIFISMNIKVYIKIWLKRPSGF